MNILSYRVGASIVGAHSVFFCFFKLQPKHFPSRPFFSTCDGRHGDAELTSTYTFSIVCSRGSRPSPPSQSMKVKIKAIIHNSERLRSISSHCMLPFKCVKGRVCTLFFIFVTTESPLRVEVKQWLRSRAVQIVCTWGLRWPCRSTTQQNNHPTNPQCKIWPLGIWTKKRLRVQCSSWDPLVVTSPDTLLLYMILHLTHWAKRFCIIRVGGKKESTNDLHGCCKYKERI